MKVSFFSSVFKVLSRLGDKLVSVTERYLVCRQRKKQHRLMRRKKTGILGEWVLDFLWTVFFVFLLNQYLLQSYVIPSGSMIPTLQVGDYLFVERWSYGPQLLPGINYRVSGLSPPRRGDIITFENPDFVSKGVWHDIAQRLVFLLTLSFVDLDVEPHSREPAVRLLVKRLVGDSQTLVRLRKGEPFFQPKNLGRWFSEAEFNQLTGINFARQRLVCDKDYQLYPEYAWYKVLVSEGVKDSLESKYSQALQKVQYSDWEEINRLLYKYKALLYPNVRLREKCMAVNLEAVRYIPEGYVLPMGDNRDNSLDGRFFGLIEKEKLQGKSFFRFFPFKRMGVV